MTLLAGLGGTDGGGRDTPQFPSPASGVPSSCSGKAWKPRRSGLVTRAAAQVRTHRQVQGSPAVGSGPIRKDGLQAVRP